MARSRESRPLIHGYRTHGNEAIHVRSPLERSDDGANEMVPPMRTLASEGLIAALDQLGSPAFVTDSRGRPVYANALGATMFERDPSGMTQVLMRRITRSTPEVRELRPPGLRPHWLVVLSLGIFPPAERTTVATRAWRLTARQAEVLRLVVTGDANKSIASKLECAEVTVEFHVTALLRKARVENRAQLVARFWTL